MSRYLILFLSIIIIFQTIQSQQIQIHQKSKCKNDEKKLVQFIALFRHGDRTPTKKFKFEDLTWPWGEGILTVNGMIRAFRLGQKFREITKNLNLNDSNVKVYSDVVSRTIDTANSLLLGLFSNPEFIPYNNLQPCISCRPKNGTRTSLACLAQCMNININNQKIPKIPKIDLNNDYVTAIQQKDVCKGFEEWYEMLKDTPGFKYAQDVTFTHALEILRGLNHGKKHLCEIHGFCHKIDLKEVEKIWTNLQCARSSAQKYVKQYSNDELFNYFNPVAEYFWRALYPSSQGTMAGGILLYYIVEILQQTKQQILNQNFQIKDHIVFFSGHDHTVFGLLAAMGGVDGVHLAEFCAHVTFSVFYHKCDIFLEVRYDEELFGVPGCLQGQCKLDEFLLAMQDKIVPPKGCDYHVAQE